MIPLQPQLKALAALSKLHMGQRKRFSGRMFIGVGVILFMVLLGGMVSPMRKLVPIYAAPASSSSFHFGQIATINGLNKISEIGSTANIIDTHGNQIAVDSDPYKIAIVPPDLSNGLKAGDILVSNIGNTTQGTTIVNFSGQQGPGHLFNKMTDGVLGPAGLAFDNRKLLVANSTGSNVLVFNPNGTLFTTITDPLFNRPWGIATGSGTFDRMSSFFTANKLDAKILRVDVISQNGGFPTFHVTQIAQLDKNGDVTKIDLHWFPSLQIANQTWKDVLLAIDPANNRVAAFAHSSSIHGVGKGMTVFQGTPLNMPGGLGVNPLNGDLLVVNLMDNNLVELNPMRGDVVGIKQIDPVVVDNQGNGSALFGVVGSKDKGGNLRVFFTDDNTNTLDVLSAP